jgi:hypothetical protein
VAIGNAPTNESTIVRLADGTLRIFHIDRPGTNRRMMSSTSHDAGLTWSASREEFALPGEAYYANQFLLDDEGALHAVFHIYGKGPLGYRGRHLDLWHARQPAGGPWSAPVKIFDGYVGSVRSFIQLRSGRLLIPMYEADTGRAQKPPPGSPDFGLFASLALYSDDGGLSWKKSETRLRVQVDPDQVSRYGAVEPVAIELEDGRLWMLIRTNKGRLYASYSSDGGVHWSEPEPSPFISSDSPAGLLRLRDGGILLFVNSCQRHDDPRSYANGGREVLHAMVSSDEGLHWGGWREVMVSRELQPHARGDRGTAYPSAAETRKGRIVFVSGQGEHARIQVFHTRWLQQRRMRDPDRQGRSRRTSHGADGSAFVLGFPMSEKGAISLRLVKGSSAGDLQLSLTDHFSIAGDSLAGGRSPLTVSLAAESLRPGPHRVRLSWDLPRSAFRLRVDGHRLPSPTSPAAKDTKAFNYIRVGSPTHPVAAPGWEVDRIRMASRKNQRT